ncbi:hypothetical protein [Streptomyces albidoflavus]
MILTHSALQSTARAIAQHLGPNWISAGDDSNEHAELIHNSNTPTPATISVRSLFQGRTIALHLRGHGPHLDPATQRWTFGTWTWNTSTNLATIEDQSDPAHIIAEAITGNVLPALDRRPRHVGDRPWDYFVWNDTIDPAPAPAVTKPTQRKARKPRSAATARR